MERHYCTEEWDQRVIFCTHLYLHVHRRRPWCSTQHPTWTQLRRSTLWSLLPVPGTLQHGPEWLGTMHSKDTSVQHVGIHRQLTSYWIQRKFTSLMKSSCFLSSASIARSSMPPGVALSLWQNRSFWISNSKSLSADNVQLLTISSTFQENVTVLITAWRRKKNALLFVISRKKDVPHELNSPMTDDEPNDNALLFLHLSPLLTCCGNQRSEKLYYKAGGLLEAQDPAN